MRKQGTGKEMPSMQKWIFTLEDTRIQRFWQVLPEQVHGNDIKGSTSSFLVRPFAFAPERHTFASLLPHARHSAGWDEWVGAPASAPLSGNHSAPHAARMKLPQLSCNTCEAALAQQQGPLASARGRAVRVPHTPHHRRCGRQRRTQENT
eukprot:76445-Chlamydomonas_euryale.AAC.4